MKPMLDCYSGDIALGDQILPMAANCLLNRSLPFAENTDEAIAFEPLLAQARAAIHEDELVLRLRTEAARLLPCDNVSLALSENGYFQIFERADGYQSKFIASGRQTTLWSAPQARLISEETADSLHCSSGIQVPLRINCEVVGTLLFLAKIPRAFQKSDTLSAQRIADCFGFVLSQARPAFKLSAPSVETDWKNDLVQAVCQGSDVHRILPEISQLLQCVIPHDRLSISLHDKDRNIWLRSASNNDGPIFERFQLSRNDCPADGTSLIINDLRSHHPAIEPVNFHPKCVDAGYRSFLVTHVWGGHHGLGFVFWSKQPHAFRRSHIPAAQIVADVCAIAVSKEGLTPDITLESQAADRSATLFTNWHEPLGPSQSRNGVAPIRRRGSTAWEAVVRSAMQVAASDTTVLLVGETGTGKEVVAQLIHGRSTRKNGPFVAVNCAALPDSLLESELFGYERGAFTGAYHHKSGHIELASKGVLFLDELSEMSMAAQAKVLRVLETKEFQPLGSGRSRRAEVRIIAATNKNLQHEITNGRFRADLYYRLGVFEISLPPLRSRREDILPLAYKFVAEKGQASSIKTTGISPEAEDAMMAYSWPGNVRELRNVIERASILCDGGVIELEHLKFGTATETPATVNEISIIEREMIERALRESAGNKARAARMLGFTRTQLYVRLRRYHIDQM
jgi:transcriptional regulator with GAF, ATPase, and Fis domain